MSGRRPSSSTARGAFRASRSPMASIERRRTAACAYNRRSRRDRARYCALRFRRAEARAGPSFRPDRRPCRAHGARPRTRARRAACRSLRDRRGSEPLRRCACRCSRSVGPGEIVAGRPDRAAAPLITRSIERAVSTRASGRGARGGDQPHRQVRALWRGLRFPGAHGISRRSCRAEGKAAASGHDACRAVVAGGSGHDPRSAERCSRPAHARADRQDHRHHGRRP